MFRNSRRVVEGGFLNTTYSKPNKYSFGIAGRGTVVGNQQAKGLSMSK
jgi:hypothetical protein